MHWRDWKESVQSKLSDYGISVDRRHSGYDREWDAAAAGKALGWASIALGAAEVLAPRALQRYLGLRHQEGVLRVLGVREIMQGVDILANQNPTPGLWARVAGDALDLAVLGKGAAQSSRPGNVFGAIAMVAGITLIDAVYARRNQERQHA